MQLPGNVVPMPAEQRAELKRLAQESCASFQGDLWYNSALEFELSGPEDRLFVAAVSPQTVLATLSYVEALEAEVGKLCGKAADLQTVINKAIDEYQALAEREAEATARATQAESRAEGLQAELAEQEAQALELVKANMGLGELLGDVLHELKEAWAQGEWQNIHHLIEHLKPKAGPTPSPVKRPIGRPRLTAKKENRIHFVGLPCGKGKLYHNLPTSANKQEVTCLYCQQTHAFAAAPTTTEEGKEVRDDS